MAQSGRRQPGKAERWPLFGRPFDGPAPTSTGVTIPNSANSPHPALVNAHGSGDGVSVRSPLDNVTI